MHLPILPLANFGSLFGLDGFVILILGLLIFGRKLPEVGKNLGKTIVEFKKGLNGGYTDDKTPEVVEDPAPKRPASSPRLTATPPARPSRSLPETEEV